MIRNIKIKKALVDWVFPMFSFLNKIITKNDKKILIYCSSNELIDNSLYIFNYLIDNKYNEKYTIFVNSKINIRYVKNVKTISHLSSIFQYMNSGHVFYCAGKLPIKPTKTQTVINMWHGVPLKKIGLLSNVSNGKEDFFTWVCAPSELFKPVMAQAFGCDLNKVFICGEPKVDNLFIPMRLKKRKLIVWAPTFRRSESLGYNDSSIKDLIPIFHNNEWDELNSYLISKNTNMIVKLHGGQDLNGFYKKKFSNLFIYSDKAFRKNKMDLWKILSQTDGLISDYSSVYINYLVLNRPICFAVPDIDDYSDTRGFVFDNPLDYMPGIHAMQKEDIYKFIDQLALGVDDFFDERTHVGKLMNKYHDGNNCKRIIEKCSLPV